jgi:hypothetical protein
MHLSLLQYTDNTVIFSPNDYGYLLHVKRILNWFALIFGLRVNYFKSSLIEINLDDDCVLGMAGSFFFFTVILF